MELGPGDLHIWSLKLLASEDEVARFKNILSSPEIERSKRFHYAVHRRAYAGCNFG